MKKRKEGKNKEMYCPGQLKRLQEIELEMLKDFDQLCEKYKLDYFLVGGSAIGAVRHHGFIPWDDDIDIGMSRKDYDQLLDITEKEYANKYSIVNNETHPEFPLMNTRWSLKGTTFVPEDFKQLKHVEDLGIFLDVFCQDNMPDDEKEYLKQGARAWMWGKWLVLSGVKYPVLYMKGAKRCFMRVACILGYYVLKILHLKPKFFYQKAKGWMLKYQDVETKRFGYMFDPQKYTSVLNKADVFPTRRVPFESMQVKVPGNVEEYLTRRFGDYMQIPPMEDRHIHPPYILDFGDHK